MWKPSGDTRLSKTEHSYFLQEIQEVRKTVFKKEPISDIVEWVSELYNLPSHSDDSFHKGFSLIGISSNITSRQWRKKKKRKSHYLCSLLLATVLFQPANKYFHFCCVCFCNIHTEELEISTWSTHTLFPPSSLLA